MPDINSPEPTPWDRYGDTPEAAKAREDLRKEFTELLSGIKVRSRKTWLQRRRNDWEDAKGAFAELKTDPEMSRIVEAFKPIALPLALSVGVLGWSAVRTGQIVHTAATSREPWVRNVLGAYALYAVGTYSHAITMSRARKKLESPEQKRKREETVPPLTVNTFISAASGVISGATLAHTRGRSPWAAGARSLAMSVGMGYYIRKNHLAMLTATRRMNEATEAHKATQDA